MPAVFENNGRLGDLGLPVGWGIGDTGFCMEALSQSDAIVCLALVVQIVEGPLRELQIRAACPGIDTVGVLYPPKYVQSLNFNNTRDKFADVRKLESVGRK